MESLTDNFYQHFEQNAYAEIFDDKKLSTRRSMKGTAHCHFRGVL